MTDLIHRAWAEFNKLKGLGLSCSSRVKFLIDSSPFDEDGEVAAASKFCFIGRLLPNSSPLNQTALKIEITLPEKYPVQPPIVRVLTPMHHPNVLKEGFVCLPILRSEEDYKASIFLDEVLEKVLDVIDRPDTSVPYNEEVAKEYDTNRAEYDRKVLETVQKNLVPRN